MKRILTTAALSLALLVPVAPAAHAKDDDGEVIRTGSCSGTADWKLKAKRDDGGIEVEWEVDSNKAGSDNLVARSRNLASGQVCRGTLTFG